MPTARLQSNAQVRSAGIDASVGFLIVGLIVSAVVLLTMLGTTADSRRARRGFDNPRPTAASEIGD